MVILSNLFSRLSSVSVAVIGDFMLDSYTMGKVGRVSPEAPVVLVNVKSEEQKAGGAGNTVLNLLSLGATVKPIGRLGIDHAGEVLKDLFHSENLPTDGFFFEPGFKTPVKNRIIADGQQIVRLDHEESSLLLENIEQAIIDALPTLLADVDIIAISDYGKGFLTMALLAAILDYAKKVNCPVIVDPKGIDFTKYQGATIIKPNLSEVYAAANLPREVSLDVAAAKLLKVTKAEILMVTRSEAGISLFYPEGIRQDYPVRQHEVKDVTGAGDTVLAMLACAVGSGLHASEAAPLCNIAAGIAIEHFGCARITLSDLAQRLFEMGVHNKIFDAEHPFALQQALKDKKPIFIELKEEEGLSISTFQKLNHLRSENKKNSILVHIPQATLESEFVKLLSELNIVDFILVGQMHPNAFAEELSSKQKNN